MDISLPSLGIGMLLLLIPLFFLWRLRTGLVRAMCIAAVRMTVQLFFIGVYLRYLFQWNNPWINTLWVLIMAAVATHTLGTRTRLSLRHIAVPAFVGFVVSALMIGFYFLALVAPGHEVFSARYFIPIFGILLGNMLGVNVMGLSTFYSGVEREQKTYYYLLGNGATRFEALLPFVREAVVRSFSPCIANMAVMGIVALPGTMIGQILGGSSPEVAIKYQMLIVVITTSASILSLMLTLWLSARRRFDAFGRLVCVAALAIMLPVMANSQILTEKNIDAVLKAMTLEEKANLLVGGGGSKTVLGAAGTTRAIERFGIPATQLTDGPAGVRIDPTRKGDTNTYYATAFPIGSCLASTWNTDLVREVGKAIGNETKEYGCDVILGPGMNLHRNPLCGRNFEYYSEDPLLTGKIAAAYINGVQSEGVGVSAKHFAVNSQETNRTSVDERVSQRAFRELYLRGYEIAVRESSPWTIMSSYNRINGQYSMGNHYLLTKILRDDWGYKGIVMSDWIGIRGDLPTVSEVHAGNDLLEPGDNAQVKAIIEGVNSGQLDIAYVDRNVRRMLEYIVKTPAFRKYQASNNPDFEAHGAITRQAACEGIVLLKNSGVLPLNPPLDPSGRLILQEPSTLNSQPSKTISLFGSNSYDFLTGGTGSGCVHPPYVVDLVEGLKNAGISTSATMTDIYRKYIEYARVKFQAERHPDKWFQQEYFGQQKYPEITFDMIAVNREAEKSDAAIITIGRQAGEGEDRDIDTEFNLVPAERDLIINVCKAFHAKQKPVIVVINSGSVIETASWSTYPDAILCAWQAGNEGGNSVADVLTGKVCPSGRLTMTWPLAATDHPATKDFLKNREYSNHEEGIYVGYRYFDTNRKDVAYPFGFGLSYTTFEYSKPSVKASKNAVTVRVTVKNTGSVAGKEVAQVYVSAPAGGLDKPAKELKAFAKTRELQPGESQTLTMTIDRRYLASFDEAKNSWVVAPGTYTFHIGSNVADIRQSATVKVAGMTELVSK